MHLDTHGLVPSLSSAHAAHLPKGQKPVGIAPWGGDGKKRREEEKEVPWTQIKAGLLMGGREVCAPVKLQQVIGDLALMVVASLA